MSGKSSRSFSAHLALRFFAVSTLVALICSFSLYHWQSERDLLKSIQTIRHFSKFIGNETIAMNLDGYNLVFVEDALRRLSAVHPVLYSYVVDPGGQIVATSAAVKSPGRCCFAWEPPLSSRPAGDFTLDFRAKAAGDLSNPIKISSGDRIVLIGIPIFEHSTSERIGTLAVAVSGTEAIKTARSDSTGLALLLFGLEVLIGLPATLLLSKRLARPIKQMQQTLERSAVQPGANETLIKSLRAQSSTESIREFDQLRQRMLALHEAIETQQSSLQEAYASASLGAFASQIAHDIRSPVATLGAVLDNPSFTEESRRLMRGAIQSIRGIAQGLLERNRAIGFGRAPLQEDQPGPAVTSSECIPLLLEKVISQKQLQFQGRPELEISLEFGTDALAQFARVHGIEFERVISNLVNNAAEAIQRAGRILVSSGLRDGKLRVEVLDNGRGIPPELVSRLGERGLSVGKPEGSGLGLFHARATVLSWGGTLSLRSKEGEGTCVELELPLADSPSWFARELRIPQHADVVIADDDESVHLLWDQRLKAAGLVAQRCRHVRSPDEMLAWFRANLGADAVYLCDYEFRGHTVNGLELLERLGITGSAILVTNRADEAEIRARCEKFGIRMIPKSLLKTVPIHV